MTDVNKTTLDNGVRIITEKMESSRSVSIGIFVKTGSRDETEKEAGISHFIEHMLFKGTKKRSALKIAREIEQVGGYVNAFTSKELTAYYAHLLDEHTNLAVDTLADIYSNSLFADKMIERERGVILEELASYQDSPDDVVHEDFSRIVFPDHTLGLPIIGTRESVSSFKRDDFMEYMGKHYCPERTVIVAAGNVNHEALVKQFNKKLNNSAKSGLKRDIQNANDQVSNENVRRKDVVQSHLCIGGRSLSYSDKRRYAFFVMNTILGSGMSSRLFQRIREKNGLCYSIYSFHEAYMDTGIFGIYAGLEEKQVKRAEAMIFEEMQKLVDKPLTNTELKRSKDQLKGSLVLSLENVSSRMSRLARNEIYLGKYYELDDLIDGINSVSTDDIQKLADELFNGPISKAYLFPNK